MVIQMMEIGRKKSIAILCLMLIASMLFAGEALVTSDEVAGYAIVSYDFIVDGDTKQFALRNTIVPENGDPVFATKEAMVQALEHKKQTLMNKRIFLSVEYTYTLEAYAKGIAHYGVVFTIEDASTLLAIPYPKYDNDEIGLRFGLKVFEDNLFGTFGELVMTAHISQGNGGLNGWENREDFIQLDVSNLAFLGTNLSLDFGYQQVQNSPLSGDLDYRVDWSGLSLFGTGLNLSFWGDYNPSSDFSSMNAEEYGVSWAYGPFFQNGSYYTLSTTVEVNDDLTTVSDPTATLTTLYTNTTLSQHDLNIFSLPLSFNLGLETYKLVDSDILETVNASSSLGVSFSLPFKFTWASSLAVILEYTPNIIPVSYSYKFSNSLSKKTINWTENFRKGLSFSLNHVYQYYPQPEYENTKTYWYVEQEISWFPFVLWRLNPSLQFSGFYAQHIDRTFMPSDDEDVSDYLRGYLSRSISNTIEDGAFPWGAILNLNLTAEFINFGFARSYVNPFVDIAIFGDSSQEDGRLILASAGVEGWGILNRFPSYPVRGSLGFNLSDVKKALEGSISFRDVEWEISIGMGLFF